MHYQKHQSKHSLDNHHGNHVLANVDDVNAIFKKEHLKDMIQPISQTNAAPTEKKLPIENTSQLNQKAMSATIGSNQLIVSENAFNNAPLGAPNDTNGKSAFLASQQGITADYLSSSLHTPLSPYELQVGTIIPGILVTGINSDLPGQIIGLVRQNVFDSVTGKYLLIPQGARLAGIYDAQITYGQERLLVVWQRIIFPNGESIALQGMPGSDLSGYAGFNSSVNHHYAKLFNSAVLMSALGAGTQLAMPKSVKNENASPTVSETLAQNLGSQVAGTANLLIEKSSNIQPTLEVEPGYEFNIMVTKDIVFPHDYKTETLS
jgi:type IV secretory pathway VirB10-like protein